MSGGRYFSRKPSHRSHCNSKRAKAKGCEIGFSKSVYNLIGKKPKLEQK
jgi:hypothetical protein